jgi:hypothetical protein
MLLMEQLKSIKKELGLEKDDKAALLQRAQERWGAGQARLGAARLLQRAVDRRAGGRGAAAHELRLPAIEQRGCQISSAAAAAGGSPSATRRPLMCRRWCRWVLGCDRPGPGTAAAGRLPQALAGCQPAPAAAATWGRGSEQACCMRREPRLHELGRWTTRRTGCQAHGVSLACSPCLDPPSF